MRLYFQDAEKIDLKDLDTIEVDNDTVPEQWVSHNDHKKEIRRTNKSIYEQLIKHDKEDLN